jgi:hypothetical protein
VHASSVKKSFLSENDDALLASARGAATGIAVTVHFRNVDLRHFCKLGECF